jgi:uncharacterized protein DUF2357
MDEFDVIRAESAVLRRFMGLALARPSIASVEQPMEQGARLAARAAYFLLDLGSRDVAEAFVTQTLSRLLRQLNHNTQQRPVVYQGRVRGRVVWPATFKAHYGQDYDPTRYVCREARRHYDTPENQLLKFMVERMEECLKLIPQALRDGACYLPDKDDNSTLTVSTSSRLEKIEAAIGSFKRNVYLHDIPTPQSVSEVHLLRAETSRQEEYADVARIYRRYSSIVVSASWDEVVRVAKRVLLLPARADSEGDRWIRLGAAVFGAQ